MAAPRDEDARQRPAPVVVGVDGSSGSARALAWAVREALDRGAAVRVVTAWVWEGCGPAEQNGARRARQTQEALVRTVLADLPGPLPDLTTEVGQGDPASVLIDRSLDGDLLVLGSRGLGSDTGPAPVVGSVADACLRHCSCPVVVLPPQAASSSPSPPSWAAIDGPVGRAP